MQRPIYLRWIVGGMVVSGLTVFDTSSSVAHAQQHRTPKRPRETVEQPAAHVVTLGSTPVEVSQLSWSSDGALLAVAQSGMQASVWNLDTGAKVVTVQRASVGKYPRLNAMSAAAISPDKQLLATGGQDGQIDLWALPGGKRLRTLAGHTDPIRALTFQTAGKRLASGSGGSFDYSARLWDVGTGTPLWTSKQMGIVSSVAFSPDGSQLAITAWEQALLLRASDGRPSIAYVAGNQHGAAQVFTVSADGSLCITAGDDGLIRGWHCGSKTTVFELSEGRRMLSLIVTRTGERVVTAGDDGVISIWRVAGKMLERRWRVPKGSEVVALAPDGTRVAVAANNAVEIWSTPTIGGSR